MQAHLDARLGTCSYSLWACI